MIAVSTDLANLLNSSDAFLMADLFTFTLPGGTVLRYTNTDVTLVIGGNTYTPSLKIDRGKIRLTVGLEVDSLDLTIYPESTDQINGLSFLSAVQAGALDGAIVSVERAFFTVAVPPVYVGKLLRFLGIVADIADFTGTEVPVTISSYLQLLDVNMPRNLYQPTCRRTLFDTGCTLVKATFARASVAAAAGSTQSSINALLSDQQGGSSGFLSKYRIGVGDGSTTTFTVTLPYVPLAVGQVYFNGGNQLVAMSPAGTLQIIGYAQTINGTQVTLSFELPPNPYTIITADFPYATSGYYDLGTVTFTSGANAGISRTVKLFTPGSTSGAIATITFALPWPQPIVPGDLFTIYPGCDKEKVTCTSRFSNLPHFSAEPYTPAPETAY